ncbi:MAG: AAC(3) family N-acetyltransferase [candidate division KSB1 bacterium]|nr:AAC(3) family N-acetyltransferase [candidate division KSB1 bacterium]MDZ7392074.1 AAC(3) family N-acetyltransferase [candidate division KSB1 bacterium]MDZ7411951.1 AAC(3) family N-acetyltransferase [candidate division KSB1 bacterium]
MHQPGAHFAEFLGALGVDVGHHVMVHSSLRRLRAAFPGLNAQDFIRVLQRKVGQRGSVLMPAFTYCFKRLDSRGEVFDPQSTPSKVGALSEVFRTMPGVVRTLSATHSFCLWGQAARETAADNAPASPLGEGSVLEWLARQDHASVLLLATDFSALSFCHYLEVKAPVPWVAIFPWHYMGVLPIGVSTTGEQPLREVPGCSKGFLAFEEHLLQRRLVQRVTRGSFWAYCLGVKLLLDEGVPFFRKFAHRLLCPPGECPACDERRKALLDGGALSRSDGA